MAVRSKPKRPRTKKERKLFYCVADPDRGSDAFLTPGSGSRISKKIRIRIRDEQPGSCFRELKNNFLVLCGMAVYFVLTRGDLQRRE